MPAITASGNVPVLASPVETRDVTITPAMPADRPEMAYVEPRIRFTRTPESRAAPGCVDVPAELRPPEQEPADEREHRPDDHRVVEREDRPLPERAEAGGR